MRAVRDSPSFYLSLAALAVLIAAAAAVAGHPRVLIVTVGIVAALGGAESLLWLLNRYDCGR